jgi:hypothetical protein
LSKHPRYKDWRKEIRRRLESARRYRNDSVHNAYRVHESSREEISRYNSILTMAYSRIRRNYLTALSFYKPLTQVEIWEKIPLIVNSDTNLVGDTLQTVIYSLEHPNEFRGFD